MSKFFYGRDPQCGDELRLSRAERDIPPDPFVCFFRDVAAGEKVAMRPGMRLAITCGSHSEARRATYETRYKQERGFPSFGVLVFDDESAHGIAELFATEQDVRAVVL